MLEVELGNVLPLREGITPERLATIVRDLVGKHWPAIERGSDDNESGTAALEAEANALASRLRLPPDASAKLSELLVTEVKARYREKYRSLARDSVEDFWRTLISVARTSHSASQAQTKLAELQRIFHSGIDKIAESFSPADAKAFRETVEREDNGLALLRQTDRKAFFARLGISDDEAPIPRKTAQHHQSVGEVALKTAVRAVVWEGIRALFRTR
jgi:hypothetical protein